MQGCIAPIQHGPSLEKKKNSYWVSLSRRKRVGGIGNMCRCYSDSSLNITTGLLKLYNSMNNSITLTTLLIQTPVTRHMKKTIWHGLWTWPPWVICAPAFNHKLKSFCIYRGFSYIFFLRKLHKRTEEIRIANAKASTWNIEAQVLPNRRTNSKLPNGGWNSKKPNNSLMWPTTVLSLFFPCRNFCAENFVIFFYEI